MIEFYWAMRNDEQYDFRKTFKDLHELMQSEVSRTRRTLYRVTAIVYDALLWMAAILRNTMIQDSFKGLMMKNSTHLQRKNWWSLNVDQSVLFFFPFLWIFFGGASVSSFPTWLIWIFLNRTCVWMYRAKETEIRNDFSLHDEEEWYIS